MSAALTGALYVGDVILAVNGESLVNAKHDEAVRALKRAGQVVDLQGKRATFVTAAANVCERFSSIAAKSRSQHRQFAW